MGGMSIRASDPRAGFSMAKVPWYSSRTHPTTAQYNVIEAGDIHAQQYD